MSRLIILGLSNLNPMVGAIHSNSKRMMRHATAMHGSCHIQSFPEGAVPGYPCEDLVLWPEFVENQWPRFEELAKAFARISPDTIYTFGGNVLVDGHVYNAVIVTVGGNIVGVVPKMYLADGNIFYDSRTLDRGLPGIVGSVHGVPFGDLLFRTPFGIIGTSICEDVWSANSPVHRQAFAGAELLVNHSASPFRSGIAETRRELLATRSSETLSTLVYVNLVGGNDGLVFDGGSYVFQNGRQALATQRFREMSQTFDVDLDVSRNARLVSNTWRRESQEFIQGGNLPTIIDIPGRPTDPKAIRGYARVPKFVPSEPPPSILPPKTARETYFEDLLEAMVLGVSDYVGKVGRFERLLISNSGGKDSALCAYVAWEVAQRQFAHLPEAERAEKIRDFVWCVSQPTIFNSEATKSIARDLPEAMGVHFVEEPIQDAFEREVEAARRISGLAELSGVTLQNIQARIRGQRMWNLANAVHGLFLYTGNMSETAVGYTTVGGDLMGAYGPVKNLPKTVIIEFIRWLEQRHGWPCLTALLAEPPSAELAANQTDEVDLMPYRVLDLCFNAFAGQKMSLDDLRTLLHQMFDNVYEPAKIDIWADRFVQLFFGSIFKWVLAPMGVHLGSLDLDRERALQLPVVQSIEWLKGDPDTAPTA